MKEGQRPFGIQSYHTQSIGLHAATQLVLTNLRMPVICSLSVYTRFPRFQSWEGATSGYEKYTSR
jgi:hypothetical protein